MSFFSIYRKTRRRWLWCHRITTTILHVSSVACLFYSLLFLRSDFHNGDECKMTYSMRNYVRIPIRDSVLDASRWHHHQHYKLYKFIDSRDPRYNHLLSNAKVPPNSDNNHCNSNSFVVLYIPGHWGSYTQCRSLGAHGIQLTQQSTSRKDENQWLLMMKGSSGLATTDQSFLYEVYCVDFAEQGTALHGNFIRYQSQYVARAIQQLIRDCSVSTVTLVGHSIGGLVAKGVTVYHPNVVKYIQNIITLATPHAGLPFAFDKSIKHVYDDLTTFSDSILLISISGGLRDELIPPELCDVPNAVSRIAGSSFGMDHKAIVWCHQLLQNIRKVLFALSKDTSSHRKSAVNQILGVSDFMKNHKDSQIDRYRLKYGYLPSIAFESGMLYNIELIVAMYSLICVFSLLAPSVSSVIGIFGIGALSKVLSNRQLSLAAFVMLAAFASLIFRGLRLALSYLPSTFSKHDLSIYSSIRKTVKTILCLSGSIGIGSLVLANRIPKKIAISSMVFLGVVIWVLLAPFHRTDTFDSKSLVVSTWSIFVIPALSYGKLVHFFCWSLDSKDESNNSTIDAQFTLQILTPIALRFSLSKMGTRTNQSPEAPFLVFHIINTLIFVSDILQVGNGYQIGHYFAVTAFLDFLEICSH
jgi:pimeloyl-ACP methyl ester carboxylesterase